MGTNKLTKALPSSWDDIPIVFDLAYASAYIFKVTEATLRDKARKGLFPAFRVGTVWRVRKDDLRQWIDNQLKVSEQ